MIILDIDRLSFNNPIDTDTSNDIKILFLLKSVTLL